MSQPWYSKQKGEGNCNTTPLSGRKDCNFTSVSVIVSSVLEEGLIVHVTCRNLIESSEDVASIAREVGVQGFR